MSVQLQYAWGVGLGIMSTLLQLHMNMQAHMQVLTTAIIPLRQNIQSS